ncbi:YrzI family small protein [Pseudoneobacillus sp. C159]
MTLNILFFTITIGKRVLSNEEFLQYEMMKKIEEDNRNRLAYFPRMF